MSVQLWSSSGRAAEEQAPLSSAEALLCDMDGTLVDSSAVVESMWDSFARDHGMSERFDEIMAYSPGPHRTRHHPPVPAGADGRGAGRRLPALRS